MRKFSLGGNGSVGAFLLLGGISFGMLAQLSPATQILSWPFLMLSVVGVVLLMQQSRKGARQTRMSALNNWNASVAHCAYRYAREDFGIAIDTNARVLHLRGVPDPQIAIFEGRYSFDDIREWGYEVPGVSRMTPGHAVGGGFYGIGANIGSALAAGAVNSANLKRATERTGLWVRVRDLNYPRWFVRFPRYGGRDHDGEAYLVQWMEILQQCINEGASAPVATPHSGNSSRYCTACGRPVPQAAAYCISCGRPAGPVR